MVLQRNHANPVWGWANPGEKVAVTIAGQSHATKADSNGDWKSLSNRFPLAGRILWSSKARILFPMQIY
jgi:hypothetical protein